MSATVTLDFLDAPVEVKADEAKGKGFFAALVSVFGNADRNGDRVLPGAFTKTLANWKQAGNPIPVIWSHQHGDLPSLLGGVDPSDIQETKEGLVVAGRLDIENNPKAAEVFAAMQKGLITNWSFAFETRDWELGSDGIRELKEIDLFEVGPTLVGANPEARTLALKSITDWNGTTFVPVPLEQDEQLEDKAGRRISIATASKLAAIREDLVRHTKAIDELLLAEDVEEGTSDGGVASVTQAELARQEMAGLQAFLAERGLG